MAKSVIRPYSVLVNAEIYAVAQSAIEAGVPLTYYQQVDRGLCICFTIPITKWTSTYWVDPKTGKLNQELADKHGRIQQHCVLEDTDCWAEQEI